MINRSAVLYDGTAGESSPTSPPTAWNKQMIYTFGGGCIRGWYQQGPVTGGVRDNWLLGQGYAMGSSSLNVYGNNCQTVTAAETMDMTKEHVVEEIGEPTATIGIGSSGGSYQALGISDSYPGLLGAVLAGSLFPESTFATMHSLADA